MKEIVINKGRWTYLDHYVGGEPFQGFEVVWLRDTPVWSMSYRGYWQAKENYKEMLSFAKKALNVPPTDAPWRGPKLFVTREMPEWRYTNRWKGDITEFSGLEKIHYRRKEIGWTAYQGGLVNRRHAYI